MHGTNLQEEGQENEKKESELESLFAERFPLLLLLVYLYPLCLLCYSDMNTNMTQL